VIDQTISHYRIVSKLSGGDKAEETRLRGFVALKFPPDDVAKDPQALSRFLREAQAASTLNHSNIRTISLSRSVLCLRVEGSSRALPEWLFIFRYS